MIFSLFIPFALLFIFWALVWAGLRVGSSGSSAQSPVQKNHLGAIDGMRGILALSVFIHHAACVRSLYQSGLWGYGMGTVLIQCGRYSVTLFFFITGFLFWTKLQRDRRPGFLKHLRSRVMRLAPAYWASLALILLVVASRSGWSLRESPSVLFKNVGCWLIFNLPATLNINGVAQTDSINAGVVWSLRMEWFFYLLIPFCGWFAVKLWRTALFFGLILVLRRVILISGFTGISWLTRDWAMQTTFFLMVCFGGGIVAAALGPEIKRRFARVDFTGAVFSLVAIALVLAVLFFVRGEYGMRESACLFVPFLLVTLGNSWFGSLTSAPTLFLGKISYSFYLLHGIVLQVAFRWLNGILPVGELSDPSYWSAVVAVGVLVILLSTLWHRLFEAPFMKSGSTWPAGKKRVPQPAAL